MTDYDSTADTLKHGLRVGALMSPLIAELVDRSVKHDASKTEDPELAVFNEFTPKLKTSTYGSDEYQGYLAAMGEGLRHHYASNRHHPEHFTHGVDGMTLVDLIEMLADWKAATERHADGDLRKSLAVQRERFRLSDQLVQILTNTAAYYGWLDGRPAIDGPRETCGVAGRAPNGEALDCNQSAAHEREGDPVHCDGSRDGLWWRDGELGGFEGGKWVLAASFPARANWEPPEPMRRRVDFDTSPDGRGEPVEFAAAPEKAPDA